MVAVEAIESLFDSVQRVRDNNLKTEMLQKLRKVRGDLAALHGHLVEQDGEIRALCSQLEAIGAGNGRSSGFVYDPPV